MNFTLDDTSPDLAYSPGWAVQSPTDPSLSRFFQGTYHTPQIDGATVNFTFTGNAVALYGTTGPTHANFSVQFDSSIINLSAYTPQQQYQQVLFQRTFGPSSQTSQHFIQLTAVLDGQGVLGRWLDLDYVLFTDGSAAPPARTFLQRALRPPVRHLGLRVAIAGGFCIESIFI
ncbi:hypothetical protein CERSUDRAFT_97493 [Gelatoporia subvermispora B]|uniref:Glycoside hydrolase family 16 protein n=1 Tax=Ceriporiopsis subvermispora (strain B) TaxID=914234 RepID=M2PED4_CERS8|nr:hypothetical protein CERSUDRAFT_97493 [Gelatoporia subvermispora B]